MKLKTLPFHSILFLCVISLQGENARAANAKTQALIYNGIGACIEGCAQASADMALRAGLTPIFVNQYALNAKSTEQDRINLFKDAAVWIQPGGFSSSVVTLMTEELRSALYQYILEGGGYVGFCAGAFTATRYSGDTDYLGFKLVTGKSSLYWNRGKMLEIMPILWNGKIRQMYFEGGPYLANFDSNTEVIATYPNGTAATIRSHLGKGKVFITGLHPEAPQWWRDAYGIEDADGTDFEMVDEMIQWVIE